MCFDGFSQLDRGCCERPRRISILIKVSRSERVHVSLLNKKNKKPSFDMKHGKMKLRLPSSGLSLHAVRPHDDIVSLCV